MKLTSNIILAIAFTLTKAIASQPDFDLGLELRNFSILQRNFSDPALGRTVEGFELMLLRFKLQANLSDSVQAEAHLLQEAELRSQPTPINFNGFSVSGATPLYVTHEWNYEELNEDAWRFNLYPDRLNFTYASDSLSLTLGRQAVSFGKTLFWNPTDWLSPFTVSTLDRSYKSGADIARLDGWLTPMQKLSLYYAFGVDAQWDESALLASYNLAMQTNDFELLVGKLKDDIRLGGGISATPLWLGGGALRAEVAFYLPTQATDEHFTRATLGYDYQFRNSLTAVLEYHYNGFGVSKVRKYSLLTADEHFRNGEITQLSSHYMGTSARYDLTALLKIESGLVINLIDGSLALSPGFTYSVADEVDLILGSFIVVGGHPRLGVARSEFGLYPSYGSLELVVVF